jgi:hypothetical protein
VAAENCETVQAVGGYGVSGNVCRGGNAHTGTEECAAGATGGIKNGIRICGAASQSSLGWGSPGNEQAEPDRAIDGDRNSNWGGGSCTHTDIAPTWWQVDLGASAAVDHADLWHRSECCPGRLHSAKIIVSSTSDFTSGGTACGALVAHCAADGTACSQAADMPNPEVTDCSGATGQYLTVSGDTTNMMSICEIEVWGQSCVLGEVCGGEVWNGVPTQGTDINLIKFPGRGAGSALVSIVVDNSHTSWCNGKLLGAASSWNTADQWPCNSDDGNYGALSAACSAL